MVEDMLAARGVTVSHQTVKLWAEKFGRHFAKDIRKRSAGRLGDKWHLDEAVITIRGKKHWLWRAVDQDGFVLATTLPAASWNSAPSRRAGMAPGLAIASSGSMRIDTVLRTRSRRNSISTSDPT